MAPARPALSLLPRPLRVCAVERPRDGSKRLPCLAVGVPSWTRTAFLQDAAPSLPLSPGVCPHVSCLHHPESGPLAALLDVACWSQTCASVLHVRRHWWACALGPPSRVTEGSQSGPTWGAGEPPGHTSCFQTHGAQALGHMLRALASHWPQGRVPRSVGLDPPRSGFSRAESVLTEEEAAVVQDAGSWTRALVGRQPQMLPPAGPLWAVHPRGSGLGRAWPACLWPRRRVRMACVGAASAAPHPEPHQVLGSQKWF